jgi:hypothetical protein
MSGIHALHALFDENNEIHPEMTVELPVQERELSKPTEAKLKSSKGKKKSKVGDVDIFRSHIIRKSPRDDRRTPCARRSTVEAEGGKVKGFPKEKEEEKAR